MERQKGYRTDWLQDAYSKGETKGLAKGLAKGKAEEARSALLRVLSRRGFAVSPKLRTRIEAEGDLSRLERWLEAAVDADSISAVFKDA